VAPSYTAGRSYLALALVNCSPDSIGSAIAEYKAVLDQEPQNGGALRGLGFCYLKRGDHGQAVGVLKRATDAAPENADTWVMLGQARALSGDMPGAGRAFEKALEINPENAGAKKGLEAVQPHLDQ
jgi:cytochrome c-type biogenesis protein CcmH/NrfG